MWVDVKTLAQVIGVSKRLIQIRIQDGTLMARKKNARAYEVDTTSLPPEWMAKLPKEMTGVSALSSVIADAPAISGSALTAIGRPLGDKEKRLYEIYQFYMGLDSALESKRVETTARWFGISPSTVRRAISRVEKGGVISKSTERAQCAWDPQAETWMKSYYLQLLKDRNINSKIAAYRAVEKQAELSGWKIGSRSSAYAILAAIPQLLMDYATGGNRALDNIFYIKRDWSTLRPAQILIGDQHICDFWVKEMKDDGSWSYFRPTFYVWEDAASRCVAGIAVDKDYDSQTVKEALYMAIRRFGLFDCTYNDNGTSECSTLVTQIIDELIALSGGKTRMLDISELYRTKEGLYVVEDEDGNIIDTAPDVKAWRAKHRRIYANVRNAKTKPIERLFSTLEMMMAEDGIPGHVVTPGAPAHQEEKESEVLQRQKDNGEILTLDEFVYCFISVVNRYENTCHSQLGCSPVAFVQRQIEKGWRADFPANPADLDFIFMDRKRVKITKGRVTVNRIQYMGEDLRQANDGSLEDVGLHMHEGERIEVRYSPLDLDRAYAVIPGSANPVRALSRVEAIEMLDEEALQDKIEWKRRNMRLVRSAFRSVAYPEKEKFQTRISQQVEAADKPVLEIEEKKDKAKIERLLNAPKPKPRQPENVLHFFATKRDRFKWCLTELIEGRALEEKDLNFIQEYRASDDYQSELGYWETYERLGGIK